MLKFISDHFLELRGDFLLKIFWNSIILGFFLLTWGVNISTIFIVIAISTGLIWLIAKRPRLNKPDWALLAYPLLYVIMGLSLIYTTNLDTGIDLMVRCIPILLFPLIFLFLREDQQILRKIFNALLLGLIFTFIYNLIQATAHSIQIEEGRLIFDSSIAGGYSFLESFNHGGSFFIGGEFSRLVHPSYVALYILTSLVFFHKFRIPNKYIYMMANIILVIYLFLLASRAALVVLVLLLVLNIFQRSKTRGRIRGAIILLLIGILAIVFNPRIHTFYERMVDFTKKENFNYTTSEQSRILTYFSCVELIKNSPWTGYGVGDANDVLYEKYKAAGYLKNQEGRYNAHNQYFQTALQVGIPYVIFLLLPFAVIFIRKPGYHLVALVLIMATMLLFESMFIRYNGIVFFAIIIPMISRKYSMI